MGVRGAPGDQELEDLVLQGDQLGAVFLVEVAQHCLVLGAGYAVVAGVEPVQQGGDVVAVAGPHQAHHRAFLADGREVRAADEVEVQLLFHVSGEALSWCFERVFTGPGPLIRTAQMALGLTGPVGKQVAAVQRTVVGLPLRRREVRFQAHEDVVQVLGLSCQHRPPSAAALERPQVVPQTEGVGSGDLAGVHRCSVGRGRGLAQCGESDAPARRRAAAVRRSSSPCRQPNGR
ncbi:hypothetical protein GCM10009601_41580 [Streptomyces thermospinosisporus]|uniref:Uncharacterized protein n=1 Tax=Streptomyces thermospinosisporus TaxID=161482 RepID=A0ABN1Z282_9ACTN